MLETQPVQRPLADDFDLVIAEVKPPQTDQISEGVNFDVRQATGTEVEVLEPPSVVATEVPSLEDRRAKRISVEVQLARCVRNHFRYGRKSPSGAVDDATGWVAEAGTRTARCYERNNSCDDQVKSADDLWETINAIHLNLLLVF